MSDTDGPTTCILEEMTIGEVEALDSEVVVFGLRSTEPYGPHLAYGTDVFQTEVAVGAQLSAPTNGAPTS